MMGFVIAGAAFILSAILQDPRGERDGPAALFLLGAALLMIGIAA